ncbi:sodium- and chloride-dependent GABA transporter 2-like [Daktulosphaira vitifoliae]|uniref:sodium- and chloride-dependent GABA transporter 2-like n=1 Tax=Daktulosphaira vitifoliae TaxID=58002 RepID=UPI0021A9F1AE|nr:sodium- and chloride-dependent GABA transporter 2-like [Daktulosphaira vitifoliae]
MMKSQNISLQTDIKSYEKSKSTQSPQREYREVWTHKLDFLFSCISVSVGLGNVWRFPYLCYKHGGGAFLVSYFISMVFCGIPIFFQEVAIGQYLGSGGMTLVGKLCPILSGTGYATMTIVFLLDVYYCVIVAWTLFYLMTCFISFPSLPWDSCDNWWNTIHCSKPNDINKLFNNTFKYDIKQLLNASFSQNHNFKMIHSVQFNGSQSFTETSSNYYTNFSDFCNVLKSSFFLDDSKDVTLLQNVTVNLKLEGDSNVLKQIHNCLNISSITPAEEYWENRVLMLSKGIEEIGGIQWELLILLGVSWIFIYFILGKGLSQSGKIVWVIAMFPYLIMGALLIRAVTLKGAGDGVSFLITPRWKSLMNSDTWIEGTTQIFFGYSVGVGTLPALGSFNRFHHNCYRDAILTCFINTVTSIIPSLITFSILGFIANSQGTTVKDVVESGPGLVFITYPQVVLQLPGARMWAIVFFVMLAMIGIDSEFCNVESFITGLIDKWPKYLHDKRKKFTMFVCVAMFILSSLMVTNGGTYIFQLMDTYAASGVSLLWVCFFQTIAISWCFGANRFQDCINQMLGFRPNIFWYICWVYLAPLVMITVFVFFIIKYEPVTYGKSYTYPWWGEGLGIFISLLSMIWIPLYALYYLITQPGTLQQRLKRGITPISEIQCREKTSDKIIGKEISIQLMEYNGLVYNCDSDNTKSI